jgi:hypothetical protein
VVGSFLVGKLLVLASGVVSVPKVALQAVSAYVVLSAGAQSRVFRVRGSAQGPTVDELPAATTLDIKRFQLELQEDLQPTLDRLRAEGHAAHIELSRPELVTGFVRKHLKETEGLDVE